MKAAEQRCVFKCEKCPLREFLNLEASDWQWNGHRIPECPEHGLMARQRNRPYRGESTEPDPSQGWPEATVD